jgi:hypothetical protein
MIFGFTEGQRHFGTMGGIIGIPLGGIIGGWLGYLPNILCSEWMFRKLQRSSNEELRAIADEKYWTFRQTLALLNLQRRGEDVQSYLPRVIGLLELKDLRSRYFGRDALALVFSPLAAKVGFWDPNAPEEERSRKIALLRDSAFLKKG